MIKSEERAVEYVVVMRPFYREHAPICMIGYAKNKDDAINGVSCLIEEHYKECLDIKMTSEIIWNKETVIKYWEQYADSKMIAERYKEDDLEIQVF